MEIDLIGNGIWSRKIYSLLDSNEHQVKIIPAREFLSSDFSKFLDNGGDKLLWIATRPEIQFEIMKKASEYKGKILLEKPIIFSNYYPIDVIIDFYINLKNINNIYLSKPWVYSIIWNEFKIICDEKKIKDIQIWRSGKAAHDFIHPSLDWLCHDIFLLLDLFDSELRFSKKSPIVKENIFTFKAKIDGINVEMTGGKNNLDKIAMWKVTMRDETEFMIDFINRTITHFNQMNMKKQLKFSVDDPLKSMLFYFLHQENGTSKTYLNSVLNAQANILNRITTFEKN